MDAHYLKDRVCDELCSAKEYAKYAIELRAMSPDWSKAFHTMSSQELEHASTFVRLFEDYYKRISDTYGMGKVPDYLVELNTEVHDMYSKKATMIKYLHSML